MDARVKLVLVIIGFGVAVHGCVEWSLGRTATAEPVALELAALERDPSCPNPHLKIGAHMRLYSACLYSASRGEHESKAQASINWAFYPVISLENDYLTGWQHLAEQYGGFSKIPDGEKGPKLDRFAVLVKGRFGRVGNVPEKSAKSDSLTGLVVDHGDGLTSEQRNILARNFPGLDFAKLLVVEEGRQPTPPSTALGLIALGLALCVGGAAWIVRRGAGAPTSPTCQACGVEAPTRAMALHQNIGALVVRYSKSAEGDLCKSCCHTYFWKFTPTTLVVGWWGMISVFITPFNLMNNVIQYLGCLPMPPVPPGAKVPQLDSAAIDKLKPATDQIFERLSKKEPLTVVAQDLAKALGVTPGQLILWVRAVVDASRKNASK